MLLPLQVIGVPKADGDEVRVALRSSASPLSLLCAFGEQVKMAQEEIKSYFEEKLRFRVEARASPCVPQLASLERRWSTTTEIRTAALFGSTTRRPVLLVDLFIVSPLICVSSSSASRFRSEQCHDQVD